MSKQYPEPKRANRWEFYRALMINTEQASVFKKQRQELEDIVAPREERLKSLELEVAKCTKDIQEIKKRIARIDHELNDTPVLKLYESEIVSACSFGCKEDAYAAARKTEGCETACYVRARDGILTSLVRPNYCVNYPKFCVPDGDYFVYLTYDDAVMNDIYHNKEDAAVYYRTGNDFRNDDNPCEYCGDMKFTTHLYFGHGKIHGNIQEKNARVYICSSCIVKTPCAFDDLIKITQKNYNSRMHYPIILSQLLYAYAHLEDSPFYKDNLPRDVFKLILRGVFPAAFAVFK